MLPNENEGGPRLMELHRAGKEYLKTILALEQKNGLVRSLDVARTLRVT